ncbi:MAG: DUF5317 domain-containing protein [Actinomycetota bacterium]|nr:DUF5317 domain-containing protein [Actinomycetota bacterium]
MVFTTVLALITGVIIGRLTGGRFRNLAAHPFRAWWLLIVGVGLQVLLDRVDLGGISTVAQLAGYVALLAFAALNSAIVGMGIIAIGVACNAVAIGLNGGMPVSPSAVVSARIASDTVEPQIGYGLRHHRQRPGDRLVFLSDIIPIPELHEVVSFGDLILAIGVADTAAHLLAPRKRHLAGERAGSG